MALSTTPELLRELAILYHRVAELERAGGLRPGEGAPEGLQRRVGDLGAGLHAALAAFSDDLLGVLTPAGDILFVNDAVERLAGYRAEEVIGKNAWSFVDEEDLASLASARSTPLDDAIPIEIRVRCADGRLRWFEFSARPWPRDNPVYIVARWRDAQGRREPAAREGDAQRLDAELRRAAALARVSQLALGLPSVQDVLDAAASLAPSALQLEAGAYLEPEGGGLVIRAAAGIPVPRGHAVPVVMTLAGLARAGGAPVHSADIVRDGRLADSLLAAAGASSAVAVPVRGKERAHGVLLVAGRTSRHFAPDEIHFLETVANVVATSVDGRAAQEAMRGRERLARAVFDHARDGLAIVDAEGRCLDANAAAEQILGTSFDALRGHRPSEVVRTELDLAPRSPRQGEATVTTASDTRLVEWDVVPDIQPGVALAMLRDVTSKREVATRLALADRLISVGALAAGVAHELNTPLAYVAANLEYLAGAVPPLLVERAGAEIREALQESVEGVERLGLILQDLRTFACPAAGDDDGPANLEAVLRSSVAMTWNEIRHRARLEKDVRRVPPVHGSPARLAQVFVNLLANAAQAIPEGDAQSHVIRISAREQPGGRVAVEVADTGSGISPAVLPRIFEPFFTTKAAGQGTGLGLSICRSIVQGLDGRIEVRSAPGNGTTFRVLLRAADVQPASSFGRGPERAPAPAVPRSRVLVVDDERLVAASLRRVLAADHDVTVVSSARSALRLVERGERFDAVLTDLVMPDMTGLELHRQLLTLAPELEKRVLFMTAGAFTEEARRATEVAPDACLEKPVRIDVLRAALARVIGARA
jgi:PAS domain S-box-containing protein